MKTVQTQALDKETQPLFIVINDAAADVEAGEDKRADKRNEWVMSCQMGDNL